MSLMPEDPPRLFDTESHLFDAILIRIEAQPELLRSTWSLLEPLFSRKLRFFLLAAAIRFNPHWIILVAPFLGIVDAQGQTKNERVSDGTS